MEYWTDAGVRNQFFLGGNIDVTRSISYMKLAVILVYEPEMEMVGLIPGLGLKV